MRRFPWGSILYIAVAAVGCLIYLFIYKPELVMENWYFFALGAFALFCAAQVALGPKFH